MTQALDQVSHPRDDQKCPRCQQINRFTAEEAAEMIPHGATVGFSGFPPAGAAKAVPRALAEKARRLHDKGEDFKIRILTGASTGEAFDEALAQADAIEWRAPYQSSKTLRKRINNQETSFIDMHLSHVAQMTDYGFFGNLDFAVVEAVDVTFDGRVYLSTSGGVSPTYLQNADKVIIEVNRYHSTRLSEMHDVARMPKPPYRSPIPVLHPLSKMGVPFASVDPSKIVGIIETDEPDGVAPFTAPDAVSEKIAGHVIEFLVHEMKAGRIPDEFLPLQSGVGNVANAVLGGLGDSDDIPPFYMYTEVFQDAAMNLLEQGKMLGASSTSLTLSDEWMQKLYGDMDTYAPKIVLRPQELSNNPGIIRRLGVIAINTALEIDIYGHANSTHVAGTQLMNGIGGSGDFMRNAYLSIFVAPSLAKKGAISAILPMCSHVDHSEHDVQIVVTDQGLADLRGLGPLQRAETIIENCAHPDYQPLLREYLENAPGGHLRHDLNKAFDMHRRFLETGSMLPQ